MTSEAVGLPLNTIKQYLTLSAPPEVGWQSDRSAAERFEDLLELRERAIARGLHSLADWYADRIVDEMTAGAAR